MIVPLAHKYSLLFAGMWFAVAAGIALFILTFEGDKNFLRLTPLVLAASFSSGAVLGSKIITHSHTMKSSLLNGSLVSILSVYLFFLYDGLLETLVAAMTNPGLTSTDLAAILIVPISGTIVGLFFVPTLGLTVVIIGALGGLSLRLFSKVYEK